MKTKVEYSVMCEAYLVSVETIDGWKICASYPHEDMAKVRAIELSRQTKYIARVFENGEEVKP